MSAKKLLRGLNPQQCEAVVHSSSPLLVVAGAGSGKTAVLARRISYLLEERGVHPAHILAITFTNKAAAEMRERVIELVGDAGRAMWVSTFHSMCVRILRTQSNLLGDGLNANFSIYDAEDSRRLLGMIISDLELNTQKYSARRLAAEISNLKNELLSPEYAKPKNSADESIEAIVSRVYYAYQRRMRAANAFDFDDLIFETVALLQRHPHVAQHYRRRFRHILVDEYQDTNHAQYVLIRELTGEDPKADPPPAELCVVGDADQSIYAFRGATTRNIEEFERDFPNAEVILLEQNYRSTQTILSAANAVIAHNLNRRHKRLWTQSGDGDPIVGYVADSDREEASFIAAEIQALSKSSIGGSSSWAYSDIAVFYRTNTGSRALEEVFVRYGIPYKVVGGTKFYERKEVRDVIAYLRAVANPDDSVSLRRILNTPRRGIGARTESCATSHADNRGISLYQALLEIVQGSVPLLDTRAVNRIRGFLELIEDLRQEFLSASMEGRGVKELCIDATVESGNIGELIEAILYRTGYRAELDDSLDPQDVARLDNLNELVAVAREFSATTTEKGQDSYDDDSGAIRVEDRTGDPEPGSLASFLEGVSLVADADQVPDSGDGVVTMMTLHTSKGLEFPVVFVVGWEDGNLPHIRSLGDTTDLSDERRLAYVGITRAKKKLYLTRARMRASWRQPVYNPESRFLTEIPAHLIDWRRPEPKSSVSSYQLSGTAGLDSSLSCFGSANSRESAGGRNYYAPLARVRNRQEHYDIGDRMNHPKYGLGKVVAKEGSGSAERITFDFDGGIGRITFMTLGGLPGEKL